MSRFVCEPGDFKVFSSPEAAEAAEVKELAAIAEKYGFTEQKIMPSTKTIICTSDTQQGIILITSHAAWRATFNDESFNSTLAPTYQLRTLLAKQVTAHQQISKSS